MKANAKMHHVCILVTTQALGKNQASAERRAMEILASQGFSHAALVPSGEDACNCDQALALQAEVQLLRLEIERVRDVLAKYEECEHCTQTWLSENLSKALGPQWRASQRSKRRCTGSGL